MVARGNRGRLGFCMILYDDESELGVQGLDYFQEDLTRYVASLQPTLAWLAENVVVIFGIDPAHVDSDFDLQIERCKHFRTHERNVEILFERIRAKWKMPIQLSDLKGDTTLRAIARLIEPRLEREDVPPSEGNVRGWRWSWFG